MGHSYDLIWVNDLVRGKHVLVGRHGASMWRTFDSNELQVAVLTRQSLECLGNLYKVIKDAGRSHKIDDATMVPTILVIHLK